MDTIKNHFTPVLYGILCTILCICFVPAVSARQPSDAEITRTIDFEMLIRDDVPSHLIDVETSDGIVILSGQTDHILARDRAEQVALAVKGVKAVVNNIDVAAIQRPDEGIESDIEKELMKNPAVDQYEIEVRVSNGLVKLEGMVDSWQEKQVASTVAKGVKGVEKIENDIVFGADVHRSDQDILADVKSILRNDVRIDDALIEVEVINGKVVLKGVVGSATEKVLVKSIAWVTGVRSVDTDALKVEFWARDENIRKGKYPAMDEETVKESVQNALFYDPRAGSSQIDVTVHRGTVTLAGTVYNLRTKRSAIEDARNVVGVNTVLDRIKVRPVEVPDDQVLKERVSEKLFLDPYLERYDLNVYARNGKVYLTGKVQTSFEKHHAKKVISDIPGVVEITNNISTEEESREEKEYLEYDFYGWNTVYPAPYINFDMLDKNRTDEEIREDIQSQLWWSPFVNEDDVEVIVEDKKATLLGTVDTWKEKSTAAQNALQGGAREVDNQLKVRYGDQE